jgi:LPXTG-motif cell wall-anchored protein
MHASTPSDPDSWSIYQLIAGATSDQLDTIEGYPMFSRLSYPLGSNPEGSNNGSSSNGELSDTGESIKILVALGVILMLAAGATLVASKKKKTSKNVNKIDK